MPLLQNIPVPVVHVMANTSMYTVDVCSTCIYGISGERDRYYRRNALGQVVPYKPVEHALPGYLNGSYKRLMRFRYRYYGFFRIYSKSNGLKHS
jgi:hypothetical protein